MRNILTLALLLVVWAPYTVLADNRCAEFQVMAFVNEIDRVAKFLDEGVDVNCREQAGSTALIMASGNGSVEVVKLLIDHGADVNARAESGITALGFARERYQPDRHSLLNEKLDKVRLILKQANAVE